ncbi:MAG TPA: polysaccharide biosynthesis tyrosine autokinase [Blastocatellia bacterium]|nr:polysaccharide biosynthesis tyrosine autokinase [Blastocatellia bacterium]
MVKNGAPEEALAPHKPASQEIITIGELSEHYPAASSGFFYPPEDIGLREFCRRLQRRKFLLLAIIVLITAPATIIMIRAKSTYLASTILQIGKDNATIIKSGDSLLQNEESDADTTTAIKTKMVTMKSHELLEDVVVNLQLDRNPKFLDGMNQWTLKRLLRLNSTEPAPIAERTAAPTDSEDRARPASERARLHPFVALIENNLNVEQIKETCALKVSFTHTDPALAAAVADEVAQNFIRRDFQGKTEHFIKAANWLEQAALELKGRVQKAEQALADYTRANNIFTTEGASTLTMDKLAKFHDRATRAEADRILKETLFEDARDGRVTEVPEVFAEMTYKSSPRIMELQKQLGELTVTEAQLSVYFGPSNPQLQETRQQIAAINEQIEASRKSLNKKLRVEYEHAARDEKSLKAAMASAEAEAVKENQAAIQHSILKQEVETAKALYTEFLQKSNQSKIQVAEQHSSIRIIDHAKVPIEAHGPRRALNILLWFTISLALGVGLALLVEFMDNTVKNRDDVAQFVRLSTLGVIPRIKSVSKKSLTAFPRLARWKAGPLGADNSDNGLLLTGGGAQSGIGDVAAAESYHALRTSVLLSASEEAPKTILVTSCESGDGKTTTAINLAYSLCELGSRVLVIDADLRRPTAHKLLGIGRHLGLSNYLTTNTDVGKLVQNSSKPGLSLLTSGPIPSNPATLISSPKMKQLLELLNNQYDHILIDSPPLGYVTDALILSTMVDGVVLVAHGSKSKREVVRRAKYDLLSVGARILGVVLNNVDPKHYGYGDDAGLRAYLKQSQ